MEFWEREELKELEKQFLSALQEKTPDFDKAKELLRRGVDINAVDSFGESILNDFLLTNSNFLPECDTCENEDCKDCELIAAVQNIPIIEFFIDNGWDTVRFGLDCIAALVHTTHDAQMFYAAKRILECPLSEAKEDYETALEGIGSEESYQRCCGKCHEEENLYFAMYELVDARMNGRPFSGIFPYYNALGKRIDKVIYFSDKNDFVKTSRGTEFNLDFGFVCGEETLVVLSSVNILFMNDRACEQPQTDVSEYFTEGIVGASISEILFEHQNITKGSTNYGQPVIIIKFDSGKELRFTHNFGEAPDETAQARFSIGESQ